MTAVLKFYKDLEKYGIIKDSQFVLNIPLELLREIFDKSEILHKQQIVDAYYEIGRSHPDNVFCITKSAEEYYTSTYRSKGSDALKNGGGVLISEGGVLKSSQTEPAMIIPEAISILKIHQQWRLGAVSSRLSSVDQEELQKCKDSPVYFYNKYVREEGQKELTEAKYNDFVKQVEYQRNMPLKLRKHYKDRPLLPSECYEKLPDFLKPVEISDEEIEEGAINFCIKNADKEAMAWHDIFVTSAKWYREQLKSKQ